MKHAQDITDGLTIPTPRPKGAATMADVLPLRPLVADPPAEAAELLDRRRMAALLGIGASTFDRLRAAGKIGPRPVRLGGALRWCRTEVLAWLARRDPSGQLHDVATWPSVWATMTTRK